MDGDNRAVLYEDDFGFAGGGHVFYPESLRLYAEFLAELNREDIERPGEFNANIRLYLELILGRFSGFHATHRNAQAIHNAYRIGKEQYFVYLRSFTLGGLAIHTGVEKGRLTQQLGIVSTDRDFRGFLKSLLPRRMESLSFINTFDLYPSCTESDDYLQRVTIPSFRVLSHNWKDVVSEVVRGANFVVLHIQGRTEGVGHEIELVRESGMVGRTVVVGDESSLARAQLGDAFHTVTAIDTRGAALDEAVGARLAQAVRSLANDDFQQTRDVANLSQLRCWVVDRQIELARKVYDEAALEGIPYDHYIPSSLSGNWSLLTRTFPEMVTTWQRIEARMGRKDVPGVDQLAAAMYAALRVFYVATTLERYHEMAIALATMGMAHRTITGDIEIMAACYRHAADCAGWHRDTALADFFSGAHTSLQREIAAKNR